MGDFEPQDPEDEEELTGAAHAGGAPAVWRRAGQQPETQATLVRPPFPPPGDADDAFGDGPLHGDDPDTGDEPPVDPHGAEVVTQQLQEFVAQLDGIEQALEAALSDALHTFKDKVAQVKAAAALYVDNQLQALEDVRQGTATVQHKLQRLHLALQAQLNVDDGRRDMGSGRDKRKKLKPSAPGTGQAKTERKTAAAEAKRTRRADRATADEDDVDALLARIKLEDAAATEVIVEEDCQPPCGRANASLACVPAPSTGPVRPGEVLLYGGECVDSGGKTRVFGDLYRFEAGKRRWSRIKSPGQPPPRSAHQAAVHRNFMYVFGGEFTSPNQERFHHYKDLWRLDITTWQWEQLLLRGAPSARSGHRMVCHKNSLLLFGGFNDVGKAVTYYNDLWQLDLENLKWTCLGLGTAGGLAAWPSPRSGCGLFIHDGGAASGSCLVLHGGYFREPGGSSATDDDVEKGVPLHDTWQFQLDEPSSSASAAPRHTWVRVKRQGMGPSPRSGFAAITLTGKKKGFLFGGVSDTEAKGGEVLISEFHSESFILGLDTQRWFPLALKGGAAATNTAHPPATSGAPGGGAERDAVGEKPPAAGAVAAAAAAPQPRPTLTTAEQALHRAATRIQANWRGFAVRKVLHVYRIGGAISEMTYAPALGFPPPSVATPFGRIGASLCYDPRNDVVWLFGGLVELGDEAEVSFDDLWALRLAKGGTAGGAWDCVRPSTVGKEQLRRMAEEQGRLESLEGSDDGSTDEDGDS